MPQFSTNWFCGIEPHWAEFFGRLGWTDGRPLTAIEIGSFEGRSTLWLLENLLGHADSRIHCIDSFAGGIEHSASQIDGLRARFDGNIAGSGHAAKVQVHQGLSRERLVALLAAQVAADLVYVDGSHQAADVLEDLVLSFRLLKPGGILICDDYLWFLEEARDRDRAAIDLLNAPKLAVDAFANIYARKLTVLPAHSPQQMILRKVAD